MGAAHGQGARRAPLLGPFLAPFLFLAPAMVLALALALTLSAPGPVLAQDLPLAGISEQVAPAPELPSVVPSAEPETGLAPAGAEEGRISHYGPGFHGRRTACGSRFDAKALTMAHKTLPCGTRVKVTNLKNRRTVIVEVTDRGPNLPGRIGDLSTAAARELDMTREGFVQARLEPGLR